MKNSNSIEQLKLLVTERDRWNASEGKDNGIPFLLRFRPHLKPFIDSKNYHEELTIIWHYESNDSSLMPTEVDSELMGQVEDALAENLEIDIQAVLAFVYVGHNQKQWHWYCTDIHETWSRINNVLSNFDKLPLEFLTDNDKDWKEYKEVLNSYGDAKR